MDPELWIVLVVLVIITACCAAAWYLMRRAGRAPKGGAETAGRLAPALPGPGAPPAEEASALARWLENERELDVQLRQDIRAAADPSSAPALESARRRAEYAAARRDPRVMADRQQQSAYMQFVAELHAPWGRISNALLACEQRIIDLGHSVTELQAPSAEMAAWVDAALESTRSIVTSGSLSQVETLTELAADAYFGRAAAAARAAQTGAEPDALQAGAADQAAARAAQEHEAALEGLLRHLGSRKRQLGALSAVDARARQAAAQRRQAAHERTAGPLLDSGWETRWLQDARADDETVRRAVVAAADPAAAGARARQRAELGPEKETANPPRQAELEAAPRAQWAAIDDGLAAFTALARRRAELEFAADTPPQPAAPRTQQVGVDFASMMSALAQRAPEYISEITAHSARVPQAALAAWYAGVVADAEAVRRAMRSVSDLTERVADADFRYASAAAQTGAAEAGARPAAGAAQALAEAKSAHATAVHQLGAALDSRVQRLVDLPACILRAQAAAAARAAEYAEELRRRLGEQRPPPILGLYRLMLIAFVAERLAWEAAGASVVTTASYRRVLVRLLGLLERDLAQLKSGIVTAVNPAIDAWSAEANAYKARGNQNDDPVNDAAFQAQSAVSREWSEARGLALGSAGPLRGHLEAVGARLSELRWE